MSDQGSANAGNGDAQPGAQLRVLTQYIKDLSFENPNAPQMLGPVDEQPSIGIRVDVGVKRMS
ncbi:MAG: protein-export chaperone SecB, partial [Alphaproteobacteria bacterium HGW-Alphaproteobacteria-12]